jgi:U3 small nucleolar RNA-associated protein 25
MAEDSFNNTATRLLTLLNVSATKKRKRVEEDVFVPAEKLNKRRTVSFTETEITPPIPESTVVTETVAEGDNDDDPAHSIGLYSSSTFCPSNLQITR